MTGDQGAELVWGIGALALVASSLVARRLPMRQTLKMALIWVAIFAVVFLGFAMRDEIAGVWERVKLAALGQSHDAANGTVRIVMSDDGHFWTDATVNGTPMRFLIDSGATVTALSTEAAERHGIEVSDSGFPVRIETANGVVHARRAEIRSFAIGPIARQDMRVTVSSELGATNLLGMNFLNSLKSWRVEGRTLVLEQ